MNTLRRRCPRQLVAQGLEGRTEVRLTTIEIALFAGVADRTASDISERRAYLTRPAGVGRRGRPAGVGMCGASLRGHPRRCDCSTHCPLSETVAPCSLGTSGCLSPDWMTHKQDRTYSITSSTRARLPDGRPQPTRP